MTRGPQANKSMPPNMKFNQQDILHIAEQACVFVVASAMLVYGLAKPVQFSALPPDTTLGELSPMQLMWAFYAHSLPFAIFIGMMEVAGAVLLLVPRLRVLGALLLTGILTNVILQDIFYEVNVGALRAAIVYQVLTLAVLWWRRDTLVRGLRALTMAWQPAPASRRKQLIRLMLAILVAVAIKFAEMRWTHFGG